jgi:hypothetical protein
MALNPYRLADVRFGAHCGLKYDIVPGAKVTHNRP